MRAKKHTLLIIFLTISALVFGQEITIKGKVVNALDRLPMPGSSILEKGTLNGTIADMDGLFELKVKSNESVIVVSSLGYLKEEIVLTGKLFYEIILVEDIQDIGEVVVIGYGTRDKKDLVESVSAITNEEIKELPVISIDQSLQGRVAGVVMVQNSSAPGGSTSIKIRGATSLTSNEPLIVLDGLPIYNDNSLSSTFSNSGGGQSRNVLSTIDPNDVESMTILKDASATAIYGSRGANGVILITTKSGKKGVSKVAFESYFGIQNIANPYEVLNARQFADLNNNARLNEGLSPYEGTESMPYHSVGFGNLNQVEQSYGNGTDWQNEILRKGKIQNYSINMNGGNENGNYNLSLGYYDNQGIILNSSFKRYSVRFKQNYKVRKWLNLGGNVFVSKTNSDVVPTDGETGGSSSVIQPSLAYIPTMPVYTDGSKSTFTYTQPSAFANLKNPLIALNLNDQTTEGFRTMGNFYGEIDFLESFKFRTSLGIDLLSDESNLFNVSYSQLGAVDSSSNKSAMRNTQNMWIFENTLSYNKSFNEIHNFSFVGGMSMQEFMIESLFIRKSDFSNPNINFREWVNGGSENDFITGAPQEYALLSYFGRANYDYNSKYYFNVTVRSDGSSRFGPDMRFGIFPSYALAWRASNEDFLKGNEKISDLKLRLSYGKTGNQEIGNYGYASRMNPAQIAYSTGNDYKYGTWVSGMSNYALGWEETAQINAGVNLGLFHDRVTITADYFSKQTNDVLVQQQLESHSGFETPMWLNKMRIDNSGFEFLISANVLSIAGFEWTTDFNISNFKNIVVEFPDKSRIEENISANGNNLTGLTILKEGESLGNFYGYRTDGIFLNQNEVDNHVWDNPSTLEVEAIAIQPNAQAGDIKYQDVNNDGQINNDDRTVIGNAFPKFVSGFNNRFSYKNFELSLFFYASVGNNIYNGTRRTLESLDGQFNNLTSTLDRWQSERKPGNGEMPRATTIDANNNNERYSDRWIEDGSFLRLKNLTFSYSVPNMLLSKYKIDNLKVYITAQNIFTLTKYTGYDPEVSSYGQNVMFSGYDMGAYPLSKTFIAGFNFNF